MCGLETLTLWYHEGSANGTWSPKLSSGSASSSCCAAAGPGIGATVPLSADGETAATFCSLGDAGGVGGPAACFLVSNEPTWSLPLYFLRMPSLWYFQNCLEASLPATRDRIFLPPGYYQPSLRELRICGGRLAWVLVLELGKIVDILVHDDPEVVGFVMRRDVASCEGFRHFALLDFSCPMLCREQCGIMCN